jgi:formyl-CoA transferase
VLVALRRRDQTGEACRVEIAMLDALSSLLAVNAGIYFATGESPQRRGNAHPTIVPYETFEAADGWVNIGVTNDRFWALFCAAAGCESLIDDDRFSTAPARVRHRAELLQLLVPLVRSRTRRDWVETLGAAGVPCGEIRGVGEACEALQLTRRGMVLETRHPRAGTVKSIASPARFDGKPPPAALPAPMLGQHSANVLRDWLEEPRA